MNRIKKAPFKKSQLLRELFVADRVEKSGVLICRSAILNCYFEEVCDL